MFAGHHDMLGAFHCPIIPPHAKFIHPHHGHHVVITPQDNAVIESHTVLYEDHHPACHATEDRDSRQEYTADAAVIAVPAAHHTEEPPVAALACAAVSHDASKRLNALFSGCTETKERLPTVHAAVLDVHVQAVHAGQAPTNT